MNYGKLQLSFILLLVMTIILSLTCLFIMRHLILTLTSLIAMVLCIIGLIYSIKAENTHKQKNKDSI